MKSVLAGLIFSLGVVSSFAFAQECSIYSGLSKNRIARMNGQNIYGGATTGPVLARYIDGFILDGAFGGRTLARIEEDRVYEGRVGSKVLANVQEGVISTGLTRQFLAFLENGRVYADRGRRTVLVNSEACTEEQLLVFTVIYLFFN